MAATSVRSKSNPPSPADEFTPGTTTEKIITFLLLCLASAILLAIWFHFLERAESLEAEECKVSYVLPEGVVLKPGPASFRYDRQSNELRHRGMIDSNLKQELSKLVPEDKPALQGPKGAMSYSEAIDKLAYDSNLKRNEYIEVLLLLGGLSGILGVLMRSLANFVWVACTRNEFDWHRWWPWYLARPVLGFFLGLVCVLFIEANLLQPGGQPAATSTGWWVGVAVLAGFGSQDFAERLRLLSQSLFGKAEAEEREVKKAKAKKAEAEKGEAEKPAIKKPEAKKAGAEKPEVKEAEAEKTEAEKPEAKAVSAT